MKLTYINVLSTTEHAQSLPHEERKGYAEKVLLCQDVEIVGVCF